MTANPRLATQRAALYRYPMNGRGTTRAPKAAAEWPLRPVGKEDASPTPDRFRRPLDGSLHNPTHDATLSRVAISC